jgi:hypothetical protein
MPDDGERGDDAVPVKRFVVALRDDGGRRSGCRALRRIRNTASPARRTAGSASEPEQKFREFRDTREFRTPKIFDDGQRGRTFGTPMIPVR